MHEILALPPIITPWSPGRTWVHPPTNERFRPGGTVHSKNSEPTIAWLGLPASMPVGPRSEAVRDRREYCARSEPQCRRGLRAAASVVTVIPRRLPGAGLVSHHVGTEGSSSAAFDRLVLHLLRRVDPDGDAPPTRL